MEVRDLDLLLFVVLFCSMGAPSKDAPAIFGKYSYVQLHSAANCHRASKKLSPTRVWQALVSSLHRIRERDTSRRLTRRNLDSSPLCALIVRARNYISLKPSPHFWSSDITIVLKPSELRVNYIEYGSPSTSPSTSSQGTDYQPSSRV